MQNVIRVFVAESVKARDREPFKYPGRPAIIHQAVCGGDSSPPTSPSLVPCEINKAASTGLAQWDGPGAPPRPSWRVSGGAVVGREDPAEEFRGRGRGPRAAGRSGKGSHGTAPPLSLLPAGGGRLRLHHRGRRVRRAAHRECFPTSLLLSSVALCV